MYKLRCKSHKVHKNNHEFKSITQGKDVMNKVTVEKDFGSTTEWFHEIVTCNKNILRIDWLNHK